jgi:alpha-tubulin suppressor-like RCC1 family protein
MGWTSLFLLLAIGCARHPTEVLVFLDAETNARAMAGTVRIRVATSTGEERLLQTVDPNREAQFPLRIPLSPIGGDSARRWIFDAWLLDAAGVERAHQHAEGGYVMGEQREVRLRFEDACMAIDCPDNRACEHGVCTHACVEPTVLGSGATTPFVPCEPCSGCWAGLTCLAGNTLDACGRGGDPCEACSCAGDTCQEGACRNPTEVISVSTGFDHTCVVAADSNIACFGGNEFGQLGTGDNVNRNTPVYFADIVDWGNPQSGSRFACARRPAGIVSCWGLNDDGQLGVGEGDFTNRNVPTPLSGAFASVMVGQRHACALDGDAHLWCWGDDEGQLGQGMKIDYSEVPRRVASDLRFTHVTGGDAHTCAIADDGSLWCWGRACCGELGLGGVAASEFSPRRVGNANDWTSAAAGRYHQCGLRNGALYCWGGNIHGQVGIPTGQTDGAVVTPTRVGNWDDWVEIEGGRSHTCGIRRDGSLWCWGQNDDGQLGLGESGFADRSSPERLALGDWIHVSAGEAHTCAIRSSGTLYCWGRNELGQLGVGDNIRKPSPVRVCFR